MAWNARQAKLHARLMFDVSQWMHSMIAYAPWWGSSLIFIFSELFLILIQIPYKNQRLIEI